MLSYLLLFTFLSKSFDKEFFYTQLTEYKLKYHLYIFPVKIKGKMSFFLKRNILNNKKYFIIKINLFIQKNA